jgi:hypothetical protein
LFGVEGRISVDAGMLKIAGAIAGTIGIITALVFIVFREIIRKKIFPRLTKVQAYRIFITIIILSFSLGCYGIYAWLTQKDILAPAEVLRFTIYRDSVPWPLVSVEIPDKKYADYTSITGEIELPFNLSPGESVKLLIDKQFTATLKSGEVSGDLYVKTPRYKRSEIAGVVLRTGKPEPGVKILTEYSDSTFTDHLGHFRFHIRSRMEQDRINLNYSKNGIERKVVVQVNQTNLTLDL